MIHVISSHLHDIPHPAVVVGPDLAIPLYAKRWGVAVPIVAWKLANLERECFAILSQPWRDFKIRKHIGTLGYEDRLRIYRATSVLPELRKPLAALV